MYGEPPSLSSHGSERPVDSNLLETGTVASNLDSWHTQKVDDEVEFHFRRQRAQIPVPFEMPPSRPLSRRTIPRQSNRSASQNGDPLVDLLAQLLKDNKAEMKKGVGSQAGQ